MSELFTPYVISEVPLVELSYQRSSINSEPIYGFDDLQSIVETGAMEEPQSAGHESRKVLATPPEVTKSHPSSQDDRNQLTLSETAVSAIAEQLSL